MKKAKGFTLVELVVVIAIIGVLAAILVPTMLNYVKKAKLRAANTNAKTAYNAVHEFITSRSAETGSSVEALVQEYGEKVIDCNLPPDSSETSAQEAVHQNLAVNGITAGHVWVDMAPINGSDSVYVQWTGDIDAENVGDPVVGQYPDPVTWETYRSDNNSWKGYIQPVT